MNGLVLITGMEYIRVGKNDHILDGRKLSSFHVSYIPKRNGANRRIVVHDLYVDGLVLRGGTPLMWLFDGGYVDLNANGSPTCWNYYVADHLGSMRKVVDSNGTVRETVNYYPFGSEMRIQAPAHMAGDFLQPYRFTGKELDRLNGLNMYDFGARWYDVAGVPMWTSVDPLCEDYYHISPYAYCGGDPVNAVDPDGRVVNLFAGGVGALAGGGMYAKQQVNKTTGKVFREAKSAASSATQATRTITTGKNWSVQMGIGGIASPVCFSPSINS